MDEVLDELDITVPPTKCTANDVILGRGRRISNWPGNVRFRDVATKYRDDYSKSNRYQKVEIALLLMDEIADRGGRFVRVADERNVYHNSCSCNGTNPADNLNNNEDNSFDCYEVDEGRAIEKTCQALRDRHYSKPVGVKKKGKFLTLATLTKSYASSTETIERVPVVSRQENSLSGDRQYSDIERCTDSEGRNKRRNRNNNYSFSTDDMLQRLRSFRSKYNHSAVPPDWEHDIMLADWCTIQRHVYRQHQSGYHKLTPEDGDILQLELFDTLGAMHFCWDYDEWHWNYWYGKSLMTCDDDTNNSISSTKSWLHQQQKQYRAGTLSANRSEKLLNSGHLQHL